MNGHSAGSRRRVMLIVETSLAYGRQVLRGINRYIVSHEPWSMYLDLRELMVEPPVWLDTWDGDSIRIQFSRVAPAPWEWISRGVPKPAARAIRSIILSCSSEITIFAALPAIAC